MALIIPREFSCIYVAVVGVRLVRRPTQPLSDVRRGADRLCLPGAGCDLSTFLFMYGLTTLSVAGAVWRLIKIKLPLYGPKQAPRTLGG